jgi:hypothetical protein
MPTHSKFLDLFCRNARLIFKSRAVDNDLRALAVGRSVYFGTIAPFLLITTALVEQLPVLFRKVFCEGWELAAAKVRVPFLEEEKQLERVRLDEHLAQEFILSALTGNENRTVEVSPTRDDHSYDGLQVWLLDILLIASDAFRQHRHQVFYHEHLGLEGLTSISKTNQDSSLDLLTEPILSDYVHYQLKNFRLKQNACNAGLSNLFELLEARVRCLRIRERGRAENETGWQEEGLQIVETVVVKQIFEGLSRSWVDRL